MGQYHYPVNWDRKEYICPHAFGDGLKLLEFGHSAQGTLLGLAVLLASSNRGGARGGGDIHPWHGDIWGSDRTNPYIVNERYEQALMDHIIGRWATERVSIIGDYNRYDEIPRDVGTAPWSSDRFYLHERSRSDFGPWGRPLCEAEVEYNLELECSYRITPGGPDDDGGRYATDTTWTDISDAVVQAMCLDYYTRTERFTPKAGEHTGVFGRMPGPSDERHITLDGRITTPKNKEKAAA